MSKNQFNLRFGDSPSLYAQYWGALCKPHFFKAPALFSYPWMGVTPVFMEIKYYLLKKNQFNIA